MRSSTLEDEVLEEIVDEFEVIEDIKRVDVSTTIVAKEDITETFIGTVNANVAAIQDVEEAFISF